MKTLKKISRVLFSMRTALILLGLLVAACIAGSVIPQQQLRAYYAAQYPDKVCMLLLLLGLDDVFHCTWFAALTGLLCLNLLGCNLIHLPRLVRRLRTDFSLDRRVKAWDGVPTAVVPEPEPLFRALGFRSIRSETRQGREYRYAVRNRLGIWGPWLTHLAMLIIIAGFALGQMYAVKYTVYGVPGQTKAVGDTEYDLTIEDFSVQLREDDTVEQYTARLTLTDARRGLAATGQASVNHPMKALGMKLYQNSTGWAARVLVLRGEELLADEILCAGEHLAVPGLEDLVLSFRAFYPDYVMTPDGPATASPHPDHPGYLYALYYQEGVLGMNVLEEGERITVEDYSFILTEPRQYTLIQLKQDPYTGIAAAGGGLMLLALLLSFYLRTEELFALRQEDGTWAVAGFSKKGGILFTERIREKAGSIHKEEQK